MIHFKKSNPLFLLYVMFLSPSVPLFSDLSFISWVWTTVITTAVTMKQYHQYFSLVSFQPDMTERERGEQERNSALHKHM